MSVQGHGCRWLVVALVLAALRQAHAVEGAEEERRPSPSLVPWAAGGAVALAWIDPSDGASGLFAWASDEASGILRELGVEARWRRGSPREIGRPGEIRVILVLSPARSSTGEPVLGATLANDGEAPVVWIHVSHVREMLGPAAPRPAAMSDLRVAGLVGVALGRVIAHELVHCLAPGLPHGKGLMSRRLGSHALVGTRMSFGPEVAEAIRAAQQGERASAPADRIVLTATVGEEGVR